MTARPFSGKSGGVTGIAEVTKWSATHEANVWTGGTSSSGGWQRAVAGVEKFSGSIEAKFQDAGDATLDVGQIVELTLVTDDGGTPIGSLSGDALITSIDYEVDIETGDPVGFTANFESDGEWDKTGVFAVSAT